MKKLILANSAILMATLALVGCGGGGGGGGGLFGGNAPLPETTPGSNLPPAAELTDTATQPSPPANTSPVIFTRDPSAEASLNDGLYEFTKVVLMGSGADVSDCPSSGTSNATCPSFSRLSLNSQGKWVADSWAYMPIQKRWVSLSLSPSSITSLRLGFSDAYSAGNSWINGAPDLSALTGVQNNGQWEWVFDGGALYQLSASSAALSGASIDASVPGLGSYTGTASAIDLYFVQKSGQLYLSNKGDMWSGASSTGDTAVYPNLASFRQAHLIRPYCLDDAVGSSYNVSFSLSSGASFTKSFGICSNNNATQIGASAEGVTTVAGRKFILLSPVTSMLSGSNSSVNQYLIGISLNEGGIASQGKVFQPGYTMVKKGMKNKEALTQMMTAMFPGDSTAQNIPMP